MKDNKNLFVIFARKAFTLIELLVVTAILAVVASAIGACLIGGIRAWDSVHNFNGIEIRALVGLEIMEKDLVNSFEFDGIKFEGDLTGMSFAAPVINMDEDKKSDIAGIGRVKYEFDEVAGALRRKTWIYPDSESDTDAFEEVLIPGLSDMSLEYYYFVQDESGQSGGWQSGRDTGTNYVGGVRISLVLPSDDDLVEIKRTIMFPISHMVVE